MPDYLPCKECGHSARTFAGRAAFCDPCKEARRREGRNRVEVQCKKCDTKFYPEARQVPTWEGFCSACSFADKVARGAEIVTRYGKNGKPYRVAVLPEDLPPTRFDREDVV